MASFLTFASLLLLVSIHPIQAIGDFVQFVECRSYGMEITLKEKLPPPGSGYWDLEVEKYPQCPITKNDVGGGYSFIIYFDDKKLCGVFANSIMTPSWVTRATVTLLLRDDNGTVLADSVACYYDTNFDATLQSFRGDITSQNLRYGGSLEHNTIDVETTVYSSEAVNMDFFDPIGRPLQTRSVKLGDPIMFKLKVDKPDLVARLLPETCYFSSSSLAQQKPLGGETLTFVKKGCFNAKDGMVRAFLPKMERDYNGTEFQMRFPAFHFTGHGESLFVHCTILACIGNQEICRPKPECFGLNRRRLRRKRRDSSFEGSSSNLVAPQNIGRTSAEEVVLTKYIIVEQKHHHPKSSASAATVTTNDSARVCMASERFVAMLGILLFLIGALLAVTCCLIGRVWHRRSPKADDKSWQLPTGGLTNLPPSYSNSVQNLPMIGSF